MDPLRDRLRGLLDGSEVESWERTVEHLDSPAYDELTRGPERFADLPADEALRPLMRAEWSRFRKRSRHALASADARDADERLHAARKASKRARYVAGSLVPVFGRKAKRLSQAAEQVQEELGDYLDSVLTQEFLAEAPSRLSLHGDQATAVARLQEREASAAVVRRADFERVFLEADVKSLRKWMR